MRRLIHILCFAALLPVGGPAMAVDAEEFVRRAEEREAQGDVPGAIIELRNALQRDKGLVSARVRLGTLYLEQGKLRAARSELLRARQQGAAARDVLLPLARTFELLGDINALVALTAPDSVDFFTGAELLTIQGRGLLQAYRLDEAGERFQRAAKLDPTSTALLQARASLEMARGNYPAAAAHLRRAIRIAPELAETWYLRGDLARRERRFDIAEADFTHAIELSPGHLPARLGRAALALDRGEAAAAVADLDVVLNAEPGDLQGLYLRSLAFEQLGDSAAASADLAQAREALGKLPAELRDTYPPALMIRAVVALRGGGPEAAQNYLNQLLQQNPWHAGARKLLASALMQQGREEEAQEILAELVAQMPEDSAVIALRALAHAEAGNIEAARDLLARAIETGQHSAALRRQLALLQMASGQPAEAATALDALLADGDELAIGRFLAAWLIREGQADAALAAIKTLLERAPAEPQHHNLAAAAKIMKRDLPGARESIAQALALEEDFVPALLNRANIARAEQDWPAAAAVYLEILEQHPDRIEALRGLAEVRYASGDPAAAVAPLRRLRKTYPEDIGARLTLAQLHIDLAGFEAAEAELDALDPLLSQEDPSADLLRAAMLLERGQPAEAARQLSALTAANQDTAETLRRIMQLQVKAGATEEALASALRVIELRPEEQLALQEAAELEIRLRKLDAAEQRAMEIEKRFPASPAAPGLQAKIALARGDAAGAVAALRTALARAPEDPALTAALGDAIARSGDEDAAIRLLTEALDQGREPGPVERRLAGIYVGRGAWASAAPLYEALLARRPDDRVALNNLTWVYQQLQDARAPGMARRLAAQAGDDPAALDTAGWVLLQNGEAAAAREYLQRAYALAGDIPDVQYHLAVARAQTGDQAGAVALLEHALTAGSFAGRAEAETLLVELTR